MKGTNNTDDRDEVLFAFHQQCARPTSEQIIAWTSRFPQFAEDIRAHAAVARDWAALEEGPVVQALDESLAARCYSQALNIIFNAERSPEISRTAAPSTTFQEMVIACGKEVYQLAQDMDIARSVLADLFNGWMRPPVSRRLVTAVVSALAITEDAFDSAMQFAILHPRLGHAKADRTPCVTPRSCEDIINGSNMSPERKRYWLGDD